MKNVTISMDDELAGWARVEAAKEGKSLSRFVADVLAERRGAPDMSESLRIVSEFLDGPGYPGIASSLPARDDLYADREDELVRRHQHPRLRPGSE